MGRRLAFRLRSGAVLETELGNASPIVEVFRDGQYDVPIDWSAVATVIDVGGHVGAFTVWTALRAPRAQITVFEPEPRNYRDLVANVRRNGLSERVTAIDAAVAVADGRALLHVPRSGRETASTTTAAGPDVLDVRCVDLRRYLEAPSVETVDVLKLDCEGAEWDVLESLPVQTLRRAHNVLVEAHANDSDAAERLCDFFRERGFEPTILRRGFVPGLYRALATIWAARS